MFHRLTGIDGLANVNKPPGWSSGKVVTAIRKQLGGRSRRVGHAGTLDPLAGGVLVVLVGRACALSDLIVNAGKEYVATIRLGVTSTTDDAEGRISPSPLPASLPDEQAVREVLAGFVGQIEQRPPAHSAVKLDGTRAYKLARRGRQVQPASRVIRIDALELLDFRWPDARVRVACGRGTYVRSLARDIGQALGVGGYLLQLVRTRVGPFRIQDSVPVESCRADNTAEWLLPPARAIEHLPPSSRVRLDQRQADLVAHGNSLDGRRVPDLAALLPMTCADAAAIIEPLAAMNERGELLAICRLVGEELRPIHVLHSRRGPLASRLGPG